MQIAVVTFDGFNEIDSLVAAHMLNRVQLPGWKAEIACPSETVRSMNGVRITAQRPLEFANQADVVLVGSGRLTREIIADDAIMSRLRLDPRRQLVGSQCSGALVLARLGLLDAVPACTDLSTRPHLEAAGIRVLEQSFHAAGNVATAGGCLSAQYLAAWVVWSLLGRDAVEDVFRYVAPVGELEQSVARAVSAVEPYVETARTRAGSGG
ncbi:MAG TPA: DJ-1/PfpI family protein [Candidatus Binatia bacterium]|jgi:transcriptional regulator GlxA family with amidase domain|nr:DJ-1/PfpI family protein [Candidatus Binatia bacterium]